MKKPGKHFAAKCFGGICHIDMGRHRTLVFLEICNAEVGLCRDRKFYIVFCIEISGESPLSDVSGFVLANAGRKNQISGKGKAHKR
jgi:hypothetical protein